jgi:hypothetical protein
MIVLFTLAFSLVVAWFLVQPHLAVAVPAALGDQNPEVSILLDRKERFLQVLKDLELDYDTKKISEPDYQQMRLSLTQDLAATLKAIDELTQR